MKIIAAESLSRFIVSMSDTEIANIVGHMGDTLAVKFKSGGTYHYHGVTAQQFAGLQKSESIGKALGAIKAKHKCIKCDQ